MREKMKLLLAKGGLNIPDGDKSQTSNSDDNASDDESAAKNKDTEDYPPQTAQPIDVKDDTEDSEYDPDFKLEPLPRAADIIAELPDYPDSEEEEEKVRNIVKMFNFNGSKMKKDSKKVSSKSVNEGTDPPVGKKASYDTVVNKAKQCTMDKKARYDTVNNKARGDTKDKKARYDTINNKVRGDTTDKKASYDTVSNKVSDDTVDIVCEELPDTNKRVTVSTPSPTKAKKVITGPSGDETDTSTGNPVRQSKRQRIEGPKSSFDPKVYVNKGGEFFTGFDPMSAEAKYRRQLRMQRFGKHERIEKSRLDEGPINVSDEENSASGNGIMFDRRPEALVLFGTDDMSTNDILEYFAEYPPHHIEWLDDSHCNVVWSDPHTSKRALLSMSVKLTAEELEAKKEELRQREKDEDEFYLLPGTLSRPPEDQFKHIWRVATKDNAKAHLLFMRFANTGDVKKKGAYLNSRYYNLYGNPNASYIKNNNYNKLKKKQSVEEEKKTNLDVKKKSKKHEPDLRRHLNNGKIDVDQIKEEYKIGKPLIETLTIEVDRNERTSDIEVRKDEESDNSMEEPSDISSAESSASEVRKVTDVRRKRARAKSTSSSSTDTSTSSVSSSSLSSSSDSSSSDSSSSDSSSSESSSESDSEKRSVHVNKKRKQIIKSAKSMLKSSSKQVSSSIIKKRGKVPTPKPKVKSKIKSKIQSSIHMTFNKRKRCPSSESTPRREKKRRPASTVVLKKNRSPPKNSTRLPSNDLRAKLARRRG